MTIAAKILTRIRSTVPLSHGGPGRSRIYYQATCGCRFRCIRSAEAPLLPALRPPGPAAIWHPCPLHRTRQEENKQA